MSEHILARQENGLGLIELYRPKALNALSLDMIDTIHQCLDEWSDNTDIQLICLYSRQAKAFCAGGDIRFLYAHKDNRHQQLQFFEREYALNLRLKQYEKPICSLVNGITMGGGIGLSLHCPLRIALNDTVFAMPETAIGFFPDIGASYLLARCPHHLGMFYALTGQRMSAQDALYLGLVEKVVDDLDIDGLTQALSKDTEISFDKVLDFYASSSLSDKLFRYKDEEEEVAQVFSADTLDTLIERLHRIDSPWAHETKDMIEQQSPLSLCVTFEQIRKAETLSLAECLQMDYGLVQHFMKSDDFYEGVRAMVVDKDKQPQWAYKKISEVPAQHVASFFQ